MPGLTLPDVKLFTNSVETNLVAEEGVESGVEEKVANFATVFADVAPNKKTFEIPVGTGVSKPARPGETTGETPGETPDETNKSFLEDTLTTSTGKLPKPDLEENAEYVGRVEPYTGYEIAKKELLVSDGLQLNISQMTKSETIVQAEEITNKYTTVSLSANANPTVTDQKQSQFQLLEPTSLTGQHVAKNPLAQHLTGDVVSGNIPEKTSVLAKAARVEMPVATADSKLQTAAGEKNETLASRSQEVKADQPLRHMSNELPSRIDTVPQGQKITSQMEKISPQISAELPRAALTGEKPNGDNPNLVAQTRIQESESPGTQTNRNNLSGELLLTSSQSKQSNTGGHFDLQSARTNSGKIAEGTTPSPKELFKAALVEKADFSGLKPEQQSANSHPDPEKRISKPIELSGIRPDSETAKVPVISTDKPFAFSLPEPENPKSEQRQISHNYVVRSQQKPAAGLPILTSENSAAQNMVLPQPAEPSIFTPSTTAPESFPGSVFQPAIFSTSAYSQSVATLTSSATVAVVQNIAAQMMVALSEKPGGAIEIILNPEELGRVRLNLQVTDGAVVVSIQTERAETADLMRRHISALEKEFKGLGYDTVSFSFDGEHSRSDKQQEQSQSQIPDIEEKLQDIDLQAETAGEPASNKQANGLDLRL